MIERLEDRRLLNADWITLLPTSFLPEATPEGQYNAVELHFDTQTPYLIYNVHVDDGLGGTSDSWTLDGGGGAYYEDSGATLSADLMEDQGWDMQSVWHQDWYVYNLQPTATLTADTSGEGITLGLINPTDPSEADTASGFLYSYGATYADLGLDWTSDPTPRWLDSESNPDGVCFARIMDKDGGYSDYCSDYLLPTINWSRVDSDSIFFSWNSNITSGQEQHWLVARADDVNGHPGTFQIIDTLDPGRSDYTDQNVEPETRYWYRVRAQGTPGTPGDTQWSGKRAKKTHVAPPSEVSASETGASTATVEWLDNSTEEDGYNIYRSNDGGATWTLAAYTGADVTSLAGVQVGSWDSEPLFKVRAFVGTYNSPDQESDDVDGVTDTSVTPATPTVVTQPPGTLSLSGADTTLDVLGSALRGESCLTYTWSATSVPTGADDPVFDDNGTNAGKYTTVTFFKAGTYHLVCTIENNGASVTSNEVTVTVSPTLSGIDMNPGFVDLSDVNVSGGVQQEITATGVDQFGDPLPSNLQPTNFYWSTDNPSAIISSSPSFPHSTGKFLNVGDADPYWTVDGQPAIVTTYNGLWLSPGSEGKWISFAQDNAEDTTSGDVDRVYRTVVNLDAGDINLGGYLASDNDLIDVLVNGQSIGFRYEGTWPNYNSYSPACNFSLTTDDNLVAGMNTIEFVVRNEGGSTSNPTGLVVVWDEDTRTVPETVTGDGVSGPATVTYLAASGVNDAVTATANGISATVLAVSPGINLKVSGPTIAYSPAFTCNAQSSGTGLHFASWASDDLAVLMGPNETISILNNGASWTVTLPNDAILFRNTTQYWGLGSWGNKPIQLQNQQGASFTLTPPNLYQVSAIGGGFTSRSYTQGVSVAEMQSRGWISNDVATMKFALVGDQGFLTASLDANATASAPDLAVDSNNDGQVLDGNGKPLASDADIEDKTKVGSVYIPGLIVPVNDDDDNNNGIPDWKDPAGQSSTDGDLIPMYLFKPTNVASGELRLYITSGKDKVRVWKDQHRGDSLVGAGDSHAYWHEFVAKLPAVSTFWIEGVKSGSLAGVTFVLGWAPNTNAKSVSASDQVRATVVHGDLGFNTGETAKRGQSAPDATWTINSADEAVELQGDGFSFWWSRDGGSPVTRMGLTDLAPFRVDLSSVPTALMGGQYQYRFSLRNASSTLSHLTIYDATDDSPLAFLQDTGIATNQLGEASRNVSGSIPSDLITSTTPIRWFDLKAVCNTSHPELVKATAYLVLQVTDGNGHWFDADTVKLTIRPVEDYWAEWSVRGNLGKYAPYPTEDGYSDSLRLDPAPHLVPLGTKQQLAGVLKRDLNGGAANGQVLVFIHGYNTTPANAVVTFDETFKRLFWTGYRGSLVGFTWPGDTWKVLPTDLTPAKWTSLFDPNVVNAFRAAMQFRDFLENQVVHWSGSHPENVNVMAHSLGGLVMFEALRLAELDSLPGDKLVNNVISVESAVWKEAFEPETVLTYPDPSQGYSGDPITYSIDEQKKVSWRFWFRQIDNGVEHNLKRLLTGKIYDSYNPNDFAAGGASRVNSYVMRNVPQETHYNRHGILLPLAHLSNRTVNASTVNDAALQNIPALMSHRTLIYHPTLDGNLRHALYDGVADFDTMIGAFDLNGDRTINTSLLNFFDVPINAQVYNWPRYSHGAAFYDDDKDREGANYDTSLPRMAAWYQNVFNTNHAIPLGN